MKSELQEDDMIEGDAVAEPGTEEPVAFESAPELETEVSPPSGRARS
jgi:hypothetical protein